VLQLGKTRWETNCGQPIPEVDRALVRSVIEFNEKVVMSMGLNEHIRAERHAEHLASFVAYGTLEFTDAVREYMRYYQTTYNNALTVMTAICEKIGVEHDDNK